MIVYLATNKVNGMQYVGITRRKKLAPRVAEHFAKARYTIKGSKKTITHAIREYGEDVFDFKIIDRADTLDKLDRAERYWIRKFKTLHPNGYNVKKGGCPTFDLAAGDVYEIDGVKYYGCGELAEHFPVSVHNIRHRLLRAGWTVRQSVDLDPPPKRKKQNCKPVTVGGKTFGSVADACRHHNVIDTLYHARKRYGWSDEEALGIIDRVAPKRKGKTINVGDATFASISEAARHFGISTNCAKQRLCNGWPANETFGLSERNAQRNEKNIAGFRSLSDASRKTGLKQQTISWRMRNGWSPEQALGIVPVHGNNQTTR